MSISAAPTCRWWPSCQAMSRSSAARRCGSTPAPAICISSMPTAIPSRCIARKRKRPEVQALRRTRSHPRSHRGKEKRRARARRFSCSYRLRLLAAEEVTVAALRGGLVNIVRRVQQLVNRRVGVDRRRARGVHGGSRLVDADLAGMAALRGKSSAGNGQQGGRGKNDLLHFNAPEFYGPTDAAANLPPGRGRLLVVAEKVVVGARRGGLLSGGRGLVDRSRVGRVDLSRRLIGFIRVVMVATSEGAAGNCQKGCGSENNLFHFCYSSIFIPSV
ncbi:hypothetical protein MPL1032_90008 [Mesorhizobium plurifarium]|uniref:Uncharacterized protein n=1 Tax=Mesorhizobium plurifarium TaxID=69974 RepID=A0A0K2W7J9_MESPL|nr:hypothetical protein MPL1032_90008 [Mesorhizobium plurifarium]